MEFDYGRLRDHVVLKTLAEKLAPSNKKCTSLVWCDGETLLVWNAVEGCVEAVSVKPVLRDGDLKTSAKIYPNPRPAFDVEKVSSNGGGRVMLLIGSQGIAGVRFPTKGSGDWEGRWEGTSVSLGKGPAEVVAVKWHPGSPLDTHVAVLTSDECLRLYDAGKGFVLWAVYLSRPVPPNDIPNSKSLGDTAVDFVFAPPILKKDYEETVWPMLVLWENGDVYRLETKLKEAEDWIGVEGPLRVHPQAEDNYGCEASSIALLRSTPPLLLLATSTGIIHHFLVMGDSLLAIERVELEPGLVLGEEPDLSSPVTLFSDPVDKGRYMAISPLGVHCITSSLPHVLADFVNSDPSPSPPVLPPSLPASDARHVLCTSIATETHFARSPLAALTHLDGDLYLAVTPGGQCIELRVHPSSKPEGYQSENKSFKNDLESLLHHASRPPLLALPPEGAPCPSDWLSAALALLSETRKCTASAWEEAATAVARRISSLQTFLAAQQETIARLENQRPLLRSAAETIADRLEEASDSRTSLASRCSSLLSLLGRHSGLTSRAASNMETSLRNFSHRSDLVSKEITRLRSAVLPASHLTPSIPHSLSEKDIYLGEPKKKVIRKHLEYLTSEIHILTKHIKGLKIAVDNLQNHHNKAL